MPPKNAKASGSKSLLPTDKIPLPIFLKMLNDAGMPMASAMAIAGKLYKTHNTQEKLAGLTVDALAKLGVDDKERRKEIIIVVNEAKAAASQPPRRAGSSSKGAAREGETGKGDDQVAVRQEKALDVDAKRRAALDEFQEGLENKNKASSSSPSKKRKRGRDEDLFGPSGPSSQVDDVRSLQFNEVLDEEVLMGKKVTINRAPVMMAWSCVVAETLGFSREEALSIASAYTEMNATAKGASLGIYDKDKEKGMEPGRGTAQPHVELMGRRMWEPVLSFLLNANVLVIRALLQTESGQWRALLKGEPVSPSKPHSYIIRSLAQMCPYLMGALYLLARSFDDPQRLNQRAYSLYCDFRPGGGGWGARGDVQLAYILNLGGRNKEVGDLGGPAPEEPAKEESASEVKPGDEFEEFEAKEGEEEFTLWDLYEE